MKVGMIGVGEMGYYMAGHLVDKGRERARGAGQDLPAFLSLTGPHPDEQFALFRVVRQSQLLLDLFGQPGKGLAVLARRAQPEALVAAQPHHAAQIVEHLAEHLMAQQCLGPGHVPALYAVDRDRAAQAGQALPGASGRQRVGRELEPDAAGGQRPAAAHVGHFTQFGLGHRFQPLQSLHLELLVA